MLIAAISSGKKMKVEQILRGNMFKSTIYIHAPILRVHFTVRKWLWIL